ncbi:MAG: OB-fold domain-containing protein [Hydrogenophilaceae bacterium]|jgi:hypothetical protein|nr:OB-fold domain-containing protein [Hydrogenophilaceae bacterium]
MELHEAPVIGPIGPYFDGVDAEYWRALNQGEFKIQRCAKCRIWLWGATWRCSACGAWDIAWEAVKPEGVVYSWIRTHQAFAPEVKDVLPYVSLLVALPHAGDKKVMGMLVGDETGLRIGARVEGVIQPASAKTGGQAVMRWRLQRSGRSG